MSSSVSTTPINWYIRLVKVENTLWMNKLYGTNGFTLGKYNLNAILLKDIKPFFEIAKYNSGNLMRFLVILLACLEYPSFIRTQPILNEVHSFLPILNVNNNSSCHSLMIELWWLIWWNILKTSNLWCLLWWIFLKETIQSAFKAHYNCLVFRQTRAETDIKKSGFGKLLWKKKDLCYLHYVIPEVLYLMQIYY